MDKQDLDTLQSEVGRAMRQCERFRTHAGREELVDYIQDLKINCSMESITRAQRRLWSIALEALERGEYEYAFSFLPSKKDEFEQWMKTRKVDAELFRKYYADYISQPSYVAYETFYTCRICNRRIKGNPNISNYICKQCREKIESNIIPRTKLRGFYP